MAANRLKLSMDLGADAEIFFNSITQVNIDRMTVKMNKNEIKLLVEGEAVEKLMKDSYNIMNYINFTLKSIKELKSIK